MVGGTGDNAEQADDSDGITVVGEVAASQDYPTVVPLLNFNFRRNKVRTKNGVSKNWNRILYK